MKKKRIISLLLAVVMALGTALPGLSPTAQAASQEATLTVDLDPAVDTGEIIHGAAGFLYGVSSEDVPTTNTLVPLKSKILVTKGALGTEHPYGDALDVAKTFLESGGQQVQMYNSNYYGVFGVTATPQQYADDLKTYICPAIVEWKAAWKEEHGTPGEPKDDLGKTIDIDEAIVYVPINEGTPAGNDFAGSWKLYYDAIKSVDKNANIAGPNSAGYGWQYTSGQSNQSFIQFCADNNCMPDVITWHELQTDKLYYMSQHMDDFKNIWNNQIDWTKYNEANGTEGVPEIPQICINEYAEIEYCGVPGRLVNWIARLEDEKITGCLPFWHQANNLNDLAASANEGNGAWWLYQWYGNMSGTTQPVTTNTSYEMLYGVSTMDEAKKLSTTLLGGWTGDITVQLDNVTATKTFADAKCVDVTVEEAVYSGFHSPVTETPTVVSGTFPVNADGSVTISIPDTLFESAYKVTVTQSTAENADLPILLGSSGDVYEAELAELSGGAYATAASSNPAYYMSGSGNRAADMPTGASMTYTINVPVDGHYRLDFVYGNGQGSVRNDMYAHDTVNAVQTFSIDGGDAESVIMESTLFQTMTGTKTLYKDLTAGTHTITVTTSDEVHIDSGMLLHDFLRVSYDAAYGESPVFHRVYEAELADFNKLLNNSTSTVTTQTATTGYSGAGYVTGLSDRSVKNGGGIRYTVVVDNSGLYNLTLRYQSAEAGSANIYVGNTATTLNRLNKTVDLAARDGWQTVTATIYLQKGINVVDLDATVDAAVDYLRVRELDKQTHSTTIEAEDATLSDGVTVADSDGASGGQYVVGMPGSYTEDGRQYLEFTYDAPSAGKYQMQVFHSNEDLAGSHSYNIKAIDKYAVVEVNDQSDSPAWTLVEDGEEEPLELYYFVDCGDHDPSTVSQGDSFGKLNPDSTDQIYNPDSDAAYNWGVVLERDDEHALDYTAGSQAQSENDKAVYTTYQRALSNSQDDLLDGKAKTETFRYAHGQDSVGINPRYISYAFELDPGKYDVTVCMGTRSDWYNNSKNPTVTLSAEGADSVSTQYSVPDNSTQTKTMTIDLTTATKNDSNKVELSVKATSYDATIQMNYIQITEAAPESSGEDNSVVTLPGGVKVDGNQLPENVYVGELAPDYYTAIDYRNLKNSTDRYFFINTFSDDTFREKTITLDLQAGKNTIRIYNDNSWNVTFGGSTATPGLEVLPNYTPNFDKFVITPMALASAESQNNEYLVDVATNSGGKAWTTATRVEENGSYTIQIVSEGNAPTVYINGVKQELPAANEDGSYSLTVSGVTADQNVGVYFIIDADTLRALCDEAAALQEDDYTANSWAALEIALDNVNAALEDGEPTAIVCQMLYEALRGAMDSLVEATPGLTYFVDCGDHDPSTVTGLADDFGSHNSTTDQIYGKDAVTGYNWGVVMERGDEKELGWQGGSLVQSKEDKAVYTTYQRALSNSQSDLADGKDKAETFRYAHDQNALPKYVSYAFELEPGQYDVTVCMGNSWGNANNPTVTLTVDGEELAKQAYNVGAARMHTMSIDLSDRTENVDLSVKATSYDATIQMNYITIVRTDETEIPVVDVTGVTLDQNNATVAEGGTIQLIATVQPENATNQKVSWSSSNNAVATVKNGVVTGVKAGTATITATTEDGNYTAYCEVTVTEVTAVCTADAAIRSTGRRDADGNAIFALNLKDARNVAAVQVTLDAPEGATITGESEFTYLNTGNETNTIVLCYLKDKTFSCSGETTIATIAVPGNQPTVRIEEVLLGSYDDNEEPAFGAPVNLIQAEATFTESSGGSGSSGGSSGSTSSMETVQNPDGSITTTVTKPDGTVTETTKHPNGSRSVVITDKNGQVEAEVTLTNGAVQNTGEPIALPMPELPLTEDRDDAPTVIIDLPSSVESAVVEIPVEDATPGTVAIMIKAGGSEEIIKTSVATENGVVLTVEDGDTIKIVDNTKTFQDVPASFWGADAVAFASSRELFNGVTATTFAPNNAMSRAMIVTVLARLEGVDTTTGSTWYEAGRQWAMENGISDGTNMNGNLTREQLAAMLYRYAGSPAVSGKLSGFSDVAKVSEWAEEAMLWAVQNGIITGSNGKLNPQGYATRAEVATMLMRYVQ